MKFAIIAAGEGSRLKEEGVKEDKPLVPLLREPMLHRLVRIFTAQKASEIILIVNAKMPEVVKYAEQLQQDKHFAPIQIVVRSTPSSMHSFYEISPYLQGEAFCLTTIDTIFKEDDFAAYIQRFNDSDGDGVMAVTDYIDDEKPLYVQTDADMNITGFLDEQEDCRFISGGIYGLKPIALQTLQKCIQEGKSRMRNFQRQLVADGLRLRAYKFSKILDVDHAEDIQKAEDFLKE